LTTLPFASADLDALRRWDTPTICNGLELVLPGRRAVGFTTVQMVAADPKLQPIVGIARTGTIRGREPPSADIPPREAWYDHVAPKELPTVAVIQDLDFAPGFGAFWGEVQTAIHVALGVRGCVTNGSFRDTDLLAPGFQILGGKIGPSHAHCHVNSIGSTVEIFGMVVTDGDVIHADHHGAVVVPAEAVRALPKAINLISRREKVILDTVRAKDFTRDKLVAALRRSNEIH